MLRPSAARGAERAEIVLLTVAAPAAEASEFEAVVSELLARLQLEVELRRVERIDVAELRQAPGPQRAYFARVWIDFATSGKARLYLEHAVSDRVLVREVAGERSNSELVREELGHILQAALEGLKAGEAIGAPRDAALKELDTAAPPAASPNLRAAPRSPERQAEAWRRSQAQIGLRYELSWLGGEARVQDGPGAVLQATWPLGFELAAYYRRPLEVEAQPVGLRLHGLSVRGLITLRTARGEADELRFGAGLGVDLVRVAPLATTEQVTLAADAWRKLALARFQASYARKLSSFLALELALGADLDLSDSRYVFRGSSGEREVFVPWRLRPLLSLGVAAP